MQRRLENIEEQLRSRREAVSRAVGAISDILSVLPVDVHNVLQAIVDQARFVAGAEYAALGIVVDSASSFSPWVFSGISPGLATVIGRHPRPVGLLGAVPNEGHTIRLPDMQQDPRFHGYPHPH